MPDTSQTDALIECSTSLIQKHGTSYTTSLRSKCYLGLMSSMGALKKDAISTFKEQYQS